MRAWRRTITTCRCMRARLRCSFRFVHAEVTGLCTCAYCDVAKKCTVYESIVCWITAWCSRALFWRRGVDTSPGTGSAYC